MTSPSSKPSLPAPLSEPEQQRLAASLRAQGRPAGAWIGRAWGASALTVVSAALGLPVRRSTAALLREGLATIGEENGLDPACVCEPGQGHRMAGGGFTASLVGCPAQRHWIPRSEPHGTASPSKTRCSTCGATLTANGSCPKETASAAAVFGGAT